MTRTLLIAAAAAMLLASSAHGADIEAPTITKAAGSYVVVFHTTTVIEAARRSHQAAEDAEKYLGSFGGVETGSMPRPDGKGFDVTYSFSPAPQ